MKILIGQDDIVRAWVAQKAGFPLSEGRAFGVWSDTQGRLTGGAVFTNFSGVGIEMTIAGRGCFSRELWHVIADYVFRHMGCTRLVVTTRRGTKRRKNPINSMARRFGFKFEGIARRAYGDSDGMQWSLLREEAIDLGYLKEGARHGNAQAA